MRIILQEFKTEIPELIGQTIDFFQVSGEEINLNFEPIVFWMNNGISDWYRFFIDSYLLHWETYDESEKEILINEDFEKSDNFKKIDIKQELKLTTQKILSVRMNQIMKNDLKCGQLIIEFEEGKSIKVLDFDNKTKQKLKITLDNKV